MKHTPITQTARLDSTQTTHTTSMQKTLPPSAANHQCRESRGEGELCL